MATEGLPGSVKRLVGLTLGDLMEQVARDVPDAEAIVYRDMRYSYAELEAISRDFANGLAALGIKKGDTLGIWMPNSIEWVIAWFGISMAGGVVVPMDTWYKPAEAEYILSHSEARGIVVPAKGSKSGIFEMTMEAKKGLPNLTAIITTGDGGTVTFEAVREKGKALPKRKAKGAIDGKDRKEPSLPRLSSNDVAFVLYTSGTTGKPKGAMLSHANIIGNAATVAECLEMKYHKERLIIPVPFSHCFGNVLGITLCLTKAACMIPLEVFDARLALELVAREKATMMHGVPTMFIRMLVAQEADPVDLSTLRTGIVAGAPCPPEVAENILESLNLTVCNMYGLTETSPIATGVRYSDPVEKRKTTVGRPLPGIEVRLVDDNNETVPVGATGEVCCRGPNVMMGYLKNPDATATTIDKDGWLHSGDLGTIDEDGYYRIVGRKKDMVIVGGFNVYPTEIEDLLSETPEILEVSGVGVNDPDLGEVLAIVIKRRPGSTLTEQQVVDMCYGKIASAKVPRYVVFDIDLPVSGRGKVLKFKLREELGKRLEAGTLPRFIPSKAKGKVPGK